MGGWFLESLNTVVPRGKEQYTTSSRGEYILPVYRCLLAYTQAYDPVLSKYMHVAN